MVSTSNLAIGGLLLAIATCWPAPAEAAELALPDLLVVPIDRIEIPARTTGVLQTLAVSEGVVVQANQLLAQLDDAQATIAADAAKNQFQIAQQVAESNHEIMLAEKTRDRERQTAVGQQISAEIADRKSKNDVRVRAAEKAEAVAGNELRRASDARRKFTDSVSQSELEGLNLSYQRAQLETKQAAFDLELDSLLWRSTEAALAEQKLAIEQATLAVDKSVADQSIAKLKAEATAIDLRMANLVLAQHQVLSPIAGVITKIHRRPGQWLQAGEPIVEVLRLDRLRAEGYVSPEVAAMLRSKPKVIIRAVTANPARTAYGQVTFVNPEVDPVKGDVKFWIEFDNPESQFLPGTAVSVALSP